MTTTNLAAAAAAADCAVSLTLAATRGHTAPETAAALRLDPLVYAALREELGVSRLSRETRAAFDAAVARTLAVHNRVRRSSK